MVIVDKKKFFVGLAMAVLFFAVLAAMFMPWFGGRNAFRASDHLFNTISKGSTYYIPGLRKKAKKHRGKAIQVTLKIDNSKTAENARAMLSRNGADVTGSAATIEVKGDLGRFLEAGLRDSDDMFHNRGRKVSGRYGFDEKAVMYAWWVVFKESVRSLKAQKKFKEAAFMEEVQNRAVAVGYNYYRIEPKKAATKAGILTFALVFYVVYTLWWGFAIFYMAEGVGLQLKAGKKKEV